MKKITDITQYANQKRAHKADEDDDFDDVPDIDNSWCWPDDPDESFDAFCPPGPERMAAIIVKGSFALYHLVREHRAKRTNVPAYLLAFARACEEPLIPAAESLYLAFFDHGREPDEIPGDLLELGLSTADSVAACVPHALRLDHALQALATRTNAELHDMFVAYPTDDGARLLADVLIAERRQWPGRYPRISRSTLDETE